MPRKPVSQLTPEELEARREKARLEARERRARRTPEQVAADNAKAAQRSLDRYRSLSAGEKAARTAAALKRERAKRAEQTPEQREAALERNRESNRRWYARHREEAAESIRHRRAALTEAEKARRLEQSRQRTARHRAARTEEERRAAVTYQSRWSQARRKADPRYRALCDLRSRLRHAVDRRGGTKADVRTVELLGCSLDEFVAHLEGQFDERMTWSNKGRWGWHIDHLVPLGAFDLTVEAELRVASHHLNHQPMWHDANMTKAAAMPPPEEVPPELLAMLLALDADFFARQTRSNAAAAE